MRLKHKAGIGPAFLGVGGLLAAIPAHAQTAAQTVTATQTAWYDNTGFNNIMGGNYAAGAEPQTTLIYHDYFTFSIPDLSGRSLSSATLDLFQPINDPSDPNTGDGINTPLLFALGSVGTAPAVVDATPDSINIFNDLAAGTVYGYYALDPSQEGMILHLSLDNAALAAIAGHQGSLFTIGGYVPANNGYTFAFTHSLTTNGTVGETLTPVPTLTLNTPVPEGPTAPSFGLLLALGASGLVVAARRK